MIRIRCPGCGSNLNAKRSLIGQTRKCPRCGQPITIAEPSSGPLESESTATPGDAARAEPQTAAALPEHHWPERLNRGNVYLICGRAQLAAQWQNNGEGWMLKTNSGYVSAPRNRDRLPSQGDFRLVELQLESHDGGRRLTGLRVYQLAARWALTSLERGDDAICAKITGPAGLNKEQKNLVRSALKELFMHQVWERAEPVLDFLNNTDYHSPGPV